MKRRGFLGSIVSLFAVPVVARVPSPEVSNLGGEGVYTQLDGAHTLRLRWISGPGWGGYSATIEDDRAAIGSFGATPDEALVRCFKYFERLGRQVRVARS